MTYIKFNTHTPVKELWATYIDAKPIHMDWSEMSWPDGYEFYEAQRCDTCGKYVVCNSGEEEHCYIDSETECRGYIGSEGPMMNYAYPIDTKRIRGVHEAALAIARLPLCVVELDNNDNDEFLALTGGGMDLSWEICEAYMRVGYLPPIYFNSLPEYAGKTLKATERWVLAGMARSIEIQQKRLGHDRTALRRLRKSMSSK